MAISNKRAAAALKAFAGRLKRARLDANLTQHALADRTGVSPKTISNAEDSAQVSLDTLVRLLDGLGRLNELGLLLAEPGLSPLAVARQKGKVRQRVRARQAAAKSDSDEWQW